MKVSELLVFLSSLPPDTNVWFEDDENYAEIGAVLFCPALSSASFIPADVQACFDLTQESGSQLLGDPTCVIWTDLIGLEEEEDDAACVAMEGAWIPVPSKRGEDVDDGSEEQI